jgi:hypothetical protein
MNENPNQCTDANSSHHPRRKISSARLLIGGKGMKYWRRAIALVGLIARDVERKHLMLAAAGLAYYF